LDASANHSHAWETGDTFWRCPKLAPFNRNLKNVAVKKQAVNCRDVLIFISFFIDAFDEDIRITKSNG